MSFDYLPPELPGKITGWYNQVKKPLPWRVDPTPYHVWLSEIMLQQTRIEAVIPYYFRFLESFPDPVSLAMAEEDAVLKLWEGLGYYSRARNLRKAAGILVEQYGGELPADVGLLKKLPGIGDYTAGAIASIACGLPEPAVDGNVLRVLTRLCACADDIALPQTKKSAADALRLLYPSGKSAGDFTEGLMELGERVCIPNGEAKCGECPLREFCAAHRLGTEGGYPVKAEKKPRRIEDRTVLLLRDEEGKLAIRQRTEAGLLAGMWEYPNFDGALTEAEVREKLAGMGIVVNSVQRLSPTRHIFTHVEWRMAWYEVRCSSGFGGGGYIAVDEAELREKYALPTAFRRKKG